MMPLNYKGNWEKIEPIGSGGQATTIKAKSKNYPENVVAIKLLNRNNDYERRLRMFREVANLKTLEHPNIPSVVETNCEHYKNEDAKLYVAIDYIPGGTLTENLNSKKPDLDEIISFIIKISEIVQYCHKRGIVHRDIKPDNILLRNSNWDDPVIIDFGISFNKEATDDDTATPTGQHMGNRFLILPEHKVGESSKRDYRSDIAAIVGLFYYLLVQKEPTILLDEKSMKPHQKEYAKGLIDNYPNHLRTRINTIFDVGFNYLIDKRWQSTESLINAFENLLNAKPQEEMDENDMLKKIKESLNQSDYQDLSFANKIFKEIEAHTRHVVNSVSKELGSDFGITQSGGINMKEVHYKNMLGVKNMINQSIYSKPIIHGFLTGSEIVIQAIEEGETKELLRSPVENINWDIYEENLRNYYIEGVANRI